MFLNCYHVVRSIFLFVLAGVGCLALSQPLPWAPGTVVLHSQQVVGGEVCFQTAELFLFRNEGLVHAFSPRQVASFRYFDAQDSLLHHLVSGTDELGIARFYEVVLAGPVRVVRLFRPRVPLARPVSHSEDFSYYVWFANERAALRQFRKKILPLLAAADPGLPADIRGQHLRAHLPADAIRIAQLFNRRASTPHLLASHDR